MQNLKRILAAAALVTGVALALPVHAAQAPPVTRAVGGLEVPEDEVAMPVVIDAAQAEAIEVVAGPRSAAMPVELVQVRGEDADPFQRARDYGRLLILLAVPAAFIGLHLHLSRRVHIVPPSS
jgi:hypothetical protein